MEPDLTDLTITDKSAPTESLISEKDQAKDATNESLSSLESTLKNSIEKIPDNDVKGALLNRVNEDTELRQKSGIDQLDDNKQPTLADGSKGLKDRQEKTRNVFTDLLSKIADTGKAAANEIANTAKALGEGIADTGKDLKALVDEIVEELDEVFITSITMLQRWLDSEREQRKHTGLRQLVHHMDPEANSTQRLATYMKGENPRTWVSADGKITLYELGNGVYGSNDPTALAGVAASNGYSSIEIHGRPQQALEVAKTALAMKVEETTFDGKTKKLTEGPYSPAFSSQNEYLENKQAYHAVTDQISANQAVRSNYPNNVFNTSPVLSQTAAKFSHLAHSQAAQKQMLAGMTQPQRAELAHEIKDIKYSLGGISIAGPQRVRSLLDENLREDFDDHLFKVSSVDAQEKFKNIKTADEALAFIDGYNNPKERAVFYPLINDMKPHGPDEAQNAQFRLDLRKSLANKICDRSTMEENREALDHEAASLTNGMTSDEQAVFTKEFELSNRVNQKIDTYNKSHGDNLEMDHIYPREISDLPRDFLKSPEESNNAENKPFLDTEEKLDKYADFTQAWSARLQPSAPPEEMSEEKEEKQGIDEGSQKLPP